MKKILLLGLFLASHNYWAQECDPAGSYTQDFESAAVPALPSCITAVNPGDGNPWVTVNNPGNGFENNAMHYQGSESAADAWFFTPGVQLTAGTYYRISYTYGNDSTDTTESLVVTMGTEPTVDAAVTFSTYNNITGGVPNVQTIELFPASESGTYYFGFHATSAANQGNLYIDNIAIEESHCGIPTNVQVTNVTATGATFSWEPPTTSNISIFSVYQYAFSTENVPPAEGNYHSPTTVDVTDLEPATTYYLFTRSFCGPIWSDWTEGVAFTTLPPCEPTVAPYYLDFEDAIIPDMPTCTILPDAEGNNWVTAENPGSGFESHTLHYSGNDEAANAWLFSRGVELTAGTFYKVSYRYGNNSADTTEKLRVTVGTAPNAASVTGNFGEHNAITGGTATEHNLEFFNVPSTGVFYFGFNAYSDASQGSLYVDDFLIEELECGTPSNIQISDITDTSASIAWEAPTTGNSSIISVYQYAYSTESTPPAEGTYEPGTGADLTDLEPETLYYVFTRTQCGPVWSDWTVTTFTTDETLGTAPHNFENLTYFPNPVKDVLEITNSSNIDTISIYNITGQLVFNTEVNSRNANLNLSRLPAGAYFVALTSGEGTKKIKILKQ